MMHPNLVFLVKQLLIFNQDTLAETRLRSDLGRKLLEGLIESLELRLS